MPLLRLLFVASVVLIPCARASACRDTGALDGGLPRTCERTASFDAGPNCMVYRDSCGCWVAQCVPDAGPPDAALLPMCSVFRDASHDGPPAQRIMCETTADCAPFHPELVCGSEGLCVCAPPGPPGCSIGHGARTPFAALGAMLIALGTLVVSRRRRAV